MKHRYSLAAHAAHTFQLALMGSLLLLLALLLPGRGFARAPAAGAAPALAGHLNPDGTLQAGATGSFDAKGYRLSTTSNGTPVFRTTGTGDENWHTGFNVLGTSGTVNVLLRSGTTIYVAGFFSTAGSVAANYVAKWNGTTWSTLGTGMDNGVSALALDGSGNLYAGGGFSNAGGVAASNIAKWNGTAWSALGTGTNNIVSALAVDGSGNVYAGGIFTTAGGVANTSRVAKWNGTAWSALGTGTSGSVYALAVDGSDNVYAGGSFTTAGGVAANYVAKWNGTAWSALGTGTNSTVNALAVDGSGNVYAGGNFTTAGGVANTSRVAKWNGTAWSALGTGTNSTVSSLTLDGNGNVYVGGNFTTAGGVAASNIAKWDGTAWSALGTGTSGTVNALAVDGSGNVYAGGNFFFAGGVVANYVAKWNGTAWSALVTGSSVNNTVNVVAADGSGNVYVGGSFSAAGSLAASNIAKWNGTAWSTLGAGTSGSVSALAVDGNGNVYAGGSFTTAGGVAASNIAKWDGTAWSALGTGTSGTVNALAMDGSGNVYAGGAFPAAGGVANTSRVAKWNGTAWSALGTGTNSTVRALAIDGSGTVYVGGFFSSAGGVASTSSVAKWNGTAWSALGTGTNGSVYALAIDGSGNVYAGGTFTAASGVANTAYVAMWNGTAWSALGTGMGFTVNALAFDGSGNVYAGGLFNTAGGVANTSRVAKWNGTAWSALGTGLYPNGPVNAVAANGGGLYAGGGFTTVGDGSKVTTYFGIYAPAPTLTSVAPNPGGLGQSITLTGSNLGSPTALTVNGASALGTIVSNTGTTLVVRVPATAATTGTVSFTNAGGTVTAPFTVMLPPGNALAFDGSSTYVAFGSTPAATTLGPGGFTLEAWVYYNGNTGTNSIIRKTGDYNLYLNNGKLSAEVWPVGGGDASWRIVNGSVSIPANRWTHVAATWNPTGTAFQLYVNGVHDAGATGSTGTISGSENLNVGRSANYGQTFLGRLDEVRIYTTPLTAANIQADMTSTTASVPASQVLYLNFDQGTPATASTGANSAYTTLYDLASGYAGTLTNFALTSGNTTSNYVESYALVVPVATAATARNATGFTATWTAPALGTVDNGYRLDVSTANDFSAPVAGSPFTVSSGTSQAVTGLSAGTTYYYRVRADKTSVTGQGGSSNTIAVCPPPVAIAQNASVTLDVNGNATLAATAVNNGSTANCGPAAASALSVSPSSFSCVDAVPATVASALSLNGSGQYLSVAPGNSLPIGNSSYTLEAWIKPTAMGAYGIIGWGNYGTGPQVNALRLFNDGRGIGLENYWWGPDLVTNTANLSGSWHHVAATYDAVANTRTLYLDGVAISSDHPGPHAVPNADNVTIGTTCPGLCGGESFNGSIDEVRIWNVARTQAQLSTSKGIGLPGSTTGLVAYYRFNEGSGTVATDATGTAANLATFVNTPTWTTDAAPVVNGSLVTLTVTDASGNMATAPAIVTVSVPATPTTTWNGSLSASPLACQNWSYGQLPNAVTSVVIPTGQPNYPTLSSGTLATKDLTINAGGSLTTTSGTTLQVNGSLTNNGSATLAGTVAFVGSAATQTLSNGGGFTTIVVSKPSGTVQLAQNLTINQGLTLSSGTLTTTSSYQVNLGGSATLSESDASYVLGNVVVNRTLAPGTAEPFAGLGLTLTPASGSTAPGATLVTRTTGTALTGVGTSQSILRYFTITPATNTGLNVQLDFTYFPHELNAIPAANLRLFKSTTSTSGPWASQSLSAVNGTTLTKTGITDFSLWTLGNSANPLPVTLTSFTATASGAGASTIVRLAWATAAEVNSQTFEVERSLDGVAFARIGTVAAAGTSPTAHTYALTDAQLPAGASLLYYRLRQVDVDGTSAYSPVHPVHLAAAAAGLSLYPNPAHGGPATLLGAQPGTVATVLDALGRSVATAAVDATGTATLTLPQGLAAGVYVVRAGSQALRLTVE